MRLSTCWHRLPLPRRRHDWLKVSEEDGCAAGLRRVLARQRAVGDVEGARALEVARLRACLAVPQAVPGVGRRNHAAVACDHLRHGVERKLCSQTPQQQPPDHRPARPGDVEEVEGPLQAGPSAQFKRTLLIG
eukprot:CAMPEP_0175499200 /NCGR_PEP_ID=MMETSP0096-20121207/5701_1 /TAXON_ID=311494 /ORGANISM="Alexandrium monilatum, Strain CCMP3105" /LENGTH=132 /DNA_ID=CAMNT_0016801239 /DNA_START=398 /DNA_END=793 /DNA_ORIENTATION=-